MLYGIMNQIRAVGLSLLISISLPLVSCSPSSTALARSKQPVAAPVAQPDDAGCPACLTGAAALFAQGRNKEAAEALRAFIDKCPNNLQMHLLFNTILMRLPDSKAEALTIARKAVQIAPDSMLAHFQTAITLLTMGNTKGSQEEFEQVIALDPGNHEAWLSLSDLYATLNEPEKAKEATRKATALNPSAQTARLRTISSLNSAGNQAGVEAQFRQYLADSDMSSENFIALGDEALNLGYFAQAGACFNRVLDSYPRSGNARFKAALSQYFAGDSEGALQTIKGSDKTPDLLKSDMAQQTHALMALCLLASGDGESAQKELAAASEKKATDLTLMMQGITAYKNGNYKEALSFYSSALSKNKYLHEARLLSAQTMFKSGEVMDALSQASELRKISGVAPRALALELSCRLKQDDLDQRNIAALEKEASRTLAALPDGSLHKQDKIALCLALVRAALYDKNASEAQAKLNMAADLNSDIGETSLLKARIAAAAGDDKTQTEELQMALAYAPGDIEVLSQLGIIYCKKNDNRAEDLLTRAATVGEPDAQALFALAKLHEKKGNIEEAVKLSKRSLENGLRGPEREAAQELLNKNKSVTTNKSGK